MQTDLHSGIIVQVPITIASPLAIFFLMMPETWCPLGMLSWSPEMVAVRSSSSSRPSRSRPDIPLASGALFGPDHPGQSAPGRITVVCACTKPTFPWSCDSAPTGQYACSSEELPRPVAADDGQLATLAARAHDFEREAAKLPRARKDSVLPPRSGSSVPPLEQHASAARSRTASDAAQPWPTSTA